MSRFDKTSEQGFVTVALLALFPLLLSGLAVALASYLAMRTQIEETHVCRVELLSSQERVRGDLVRLLRLNKYATQLRLQRKLAENAVATSVTPPQLAAATTALNAVRAAQMILAAQQKALIAAATLESHLGPEHARMAVESALRKSQVVQNDRPAAVNSPAHTRQGAFDLVATPEDSETPDYNPASGFSESQNMSVSTEIKVDSVLPQFLSGPLLAVQLDLNLKIDCSATIRKGDDQWHTTLNAAKS
jgi:hypothetical protein